uniref:Uncharacterized protein n=1 Tax=uncultured marine thaumarchaeote KM3_03_F11 TaxID=1455961 RepID=A0A075G1Q1_9ARCH|nr:hypothetical protein [uncultured marine thaumarchaeote KM3_03_F11]
MSGLVVYTNLFGHRPNPQYFISSEFAFRITSESQLHPQLHRLWCNFVGDSVCFLAINKSLARVSVATLHLPVKII